MAVRMLDYSKVTFYFHVFYCRVKERVIPFLELELVSMTLRGLKAKLL